MRGVVAVVAGESGRCNQFWADYQQLRCPDDVEPFTVLGGRLGPSRDEAVRYLLRHDGEWIVFLDDDHRIDRDWLLRLIARPSVPILGSVYVGQSPPFEPRVYGPPYVIDGHVEFAKMSLTELPTTGVHPVYAVGTSGLMVRREVFEQMAPPWFPLGMWDEYGEDLAFCHQAQQLGIPVQVDVESRLGHLTFMYAWPDVIDGQWVTALRKEWLKIPLPAVERPDPAPMVVG
jgi:hypothetical protein